MGNHGFKGIRLNAGRVLVKEIQPHVVKKSNEIIMNDVLDKTLNVHVRKATVLARGPDLNYIYSSYDERLLECYGPGDVVILPDDSDNGKSIVLEGEEYIIFKQSDIIAKIELEKGKNINKNEKGLDNSLNGPVDIVTGAAVGSVSAATHLAQDNGGYAGGYDGGCGGGGGDGGGGDGGD